MTMCHICLKDGECTKIERLDICKECLNDVKKIEENNV
jgi:hypothetical protein